MENLATVIWDMSPVYPHENINPPAIPWRPTLLPPDIFVSSRDANDGCVQSRNHMISADTQGLVLRVETPVLRLTTDIQVWHGFLPRAVECFID